MAKRKVNKAGEIRNYLSENKDAKPAEIVAALKKRKIVVTPQQVSTTKNQMKKKAAKGANGKQRRSFKPSSIKQPKRGRPSNASVQVEDLRLAKSFVSQIGGIQKATEAIHVLQEILED